MERWSHFPKEKHQISAGEMQKKDKKDKNITQKKQYDFSWTTVLYVQNIKRNSILTLNHRILTQTAQLFDDGRQGTVGNTLQFTGHPIW